MGGEYVDSNKAMGMLFGSPSSLVGFVSSVSSESDMKDCGGDKNLSWRAIGSGEVWEGARFTSDLSGEDLLLGRFIGGRASSASG